MGKLWFEKEANDVQTKRYRLRMVPKKSFYGWKHATTKNTDEKCQHQLQQSTTSTINFPTKAFKTQTKLNSNVNVYRLCVRQVVWVWVYVRRASVWMVVCVCVWGSVFVFANIQFTHMFESSVEWWQMLIRLLHRRFSFLIAISFSYCIYLPIKVLVVAALCLSSPPPLLQSNRFNYGQWPPFADHFDNNKFWENEKPNKIVELEFGEIW